MAAYYNENDPFAAQWLRNLISAGHLAAGDVDERSIVDVRPDDLRGYKQCHFFAGIGGWSLALRLAGWPDERPVWTGSCPCQPFSTAGKRRGVEDERHLWPVWRDLIAECAPPVVFGEQVASRAGRDWLGSVRAEMEALGYAVAAADLCAAGVGAPHIRQRLWFVGMADSEHNGSSTVNESGKSQEARRLLKPEGLRATGGLADSDDPRPQGRRERGNGSDQRASWAASVACGLADSAGERHHGLDALLRAEEAGRHTADLRQVAGCRAEGRADPPHDPWRDADWLYCRDGKWRPVEPGTFPLADGIPARVGRLRAYGNAIVPQVAATFIRQFMTVTDTTKEAAE